MIYLISQKYNMNHHLKKQKEPFMKKILICAFFISLTFGMSRYSFAEPIPGQSTATSAEERMESWALHVKMERESPYRYLPWQAVGPKFQGGRIETITSPIGHPSVIYIGVGSGNIWKTENSGVTWKPVFEHQETFTIGDMEVAPSDPDVIWVGTGENLMARSSFAGTGVYKSTDAGETWSHTGLIETHHIARIAVHPSDPETVYVAALGHNYTYNPERGLYKTEDGGKTWEKSLYLSEKVGVTDVVLDPSDPQTVYAAAWERDRKAWNNVVSGKGSGIYKSTDGGETWSQLTNGFPVGDFVGRIGLDVCRSNPSVVYAVLDNQKNIKNEKQGPERKIRGEVYRSQDKGKTWIKVNQGPLNAGVNYSFGDIRVSPDNENTVFVLGVNLLMSEDGGQTYQKLGGTISHLNYHTTRALHLDHHDMWINPLNSDRILLGNDGGFYISEDQGQNWLHINNLPIAEFYAITLDQRDPFLIYGGTQDDAALFGPHDQEQEYGIEDPWEHIWIDLWGGGDSYFTYRDRLNPDLFYYEQQFGSLKRKNIKTGKTVSIRPRVKEGEPELRFNWMTPFIISHHNPLILYCGANKVFKSLNRGDSWQCISPDLTSRPGPEKQGNVPYGTITMISESPLQPGILYVGTDDGRVHLTKNNGHTWIRLDQELPKKWVSRVEASSHKHSRVYVSLTGYREDDFTAYIYRSDDFGATWTDIGTELPDEPVNVIREDPKKENILYVGTDHGGVFVSLDLGSNWDSLSSTLPTCAVHDIQVHSRDRKMVIGTHGRSCFVLDVQPVQEYTKEVRQKKAHLFSIRSARLPRQRDYARDWALETQENVFIYYHLKQTEPVDITLLDKEGNAVKKIQGTGEPGINTAVWDLIPESQETQSSVYFRGVSLVNPGLYHVQIKAGEQILKGQFRVHEPDINP
ncbi:MAG: hypothetical protein GF421_09545 [Candidatus Aminicenantes bacterium]|nr:hypothetical protein [Candidatus Aminicenantes bacterium]